MNHSIVPQVPSPRDSDDIIELRRAINMHQPKSNHPNAPAPLTWDQLCTLHSEAESTIVRHPCDYCHSKLHTVNQDCDRPEVWKWKSARAAYLAHILLSQPQAGLEEEEDESLYLQFKEKEAAKKLAKAAQAERIVGCKRLLADILERQRAAKIPRNNSD